MMRAIDKIRITISFVILCISAVFWLFLLIDAGNTLTVHHCPITDLGPSSPSVQMLLEMNPLGSLLAGWTLMVIAMMLPKLILPIRYIYRRSLKRRRFLSALLFVFGYVGVWMITGVFIIAIVFGSHLLMPKSFLPIGGIGIMAVIWQFTPIKQLCLNRGHYHRKLAVFGWAASLDALMFGIMHGVWCVGSGWALMLFPMLLSKGQNFAMIFVTFVMSSEHLEYPRSPKWRIEFPMKLLRTVIVQTQIKLKHLAN